MYRKDAKTIDERVETNRVDGKDWLKHIAIINNRIIHLDRMLDITDQKTLMIEGYNYNPRRIAFYILHRRWPSRGFKLPWE